MPVQRLEVYKCLVCGIVVEVLDAGVGEPVCCGQKMAHQAPGGVGGEASLHTPVVRRAEGQLTVRVGADEHPSDRRHHIQWVQLLCDEKAQKAFLAPGMAPAAVFADPTGPVRVRAFCTLHGLWQTDA